MISIRAAPELYITILVNTDLGCTILKLARTTANIEAKNRAVMLRYLPTDSSRSLSNLRASIEKLRPRTSDI